jgi:hypothetical protein
MVQTVREVERNMKHIRRLRTKTLSTPYNITVPYYLAILVISLVWNVRESICQENITVATLEPSLLSNSSSTNETVSPTSVNDTIDWEYENIVALRWKIQNPPRVSYNGLQFDLHFTVSDYVEAQHVRYDLYESDSCGKEGSLITETGLIDGWIEEDSTPVGGGLGTRTITLSNKLNPSNITNSAIYEEEEDGGDNAKISYCARFSLWSSGTTDPAATEVNAVTVTVTLSVNLKDDFSISGQSVEAKERRVETTDDEFFVEAFLCTEEGERPTDVLPYLQGQAVFVCVQPTQQAYDVGFRMRRIDKFTFEQGYTTQEAIINQEVASNGLTELWCEPGVDQCMFETLLFAYFFQNSQGIVSGTGVASLQWVASDAPILVEENDLDDAKHRRYLQESSKKFSIDLFSVQALQNGIWEKYSSGATTLEPGSAWQHTTLMVMTLIGCLIHFIP